MSKVSIRQPLVLYAFVFMLLASFVVLTVATYALVRGSRRAYRRATTAQLSALAAGRSAETVRRLIASSQGPPPATRLRVVTATAGTRHADLRLARAALRGRPPLDVVAVPLSSPGREAYLVAELNPTIATSIAFSEIARLAPLMLVGALACAAALAFMTARLVMPPLTALAEVAQSPRANGQEDLVESDAPNEIVEVARRFRRTVRLLNAERELAEVQKEELQRMQESLVQASKLASVGRLAVGIAHEIGNPLAAVKGYLSLMRQGLSPSERDDVLDRTLRELERIHVTIKKLLMYARPPLTPAQPAAPFAVAKVIDEVVELVRNHPVLRHVDLRPRGVDPTLQAQGHPYQLHQVLVNLVLNAGQAMEHTPDPWIELTAGHRADAVELTVRDCGPGIAAAHRGQIFDPFFTTKAPGEGTGLGLAVSRAVVEAMGGKLVLQTGDKAPETQTGDKAPDLQTGDKARTGDSAPGATFVIRLRPAADPTRVADPSPVADPTPPVDSGSTPDVT